MQQEKSTIIDPIHDDMENLMGIIQGTLMAERAEGNSQEQHMKAARFRNFIGKEYLTPSTLTKGVLSFCQATRKKPTHVSQLRKGAGVFRDIQRSPNLADVATKTVFGKKVLQ
jgi:hypothetical protein